MLVGISLLAAIAVFAYLRMNDRQQLHIIEKTLGLLILGSGLILGGLSLLRYALSDPLVLNRATFGPISRYFAGLLS